MQSAPPARLTPTIVPPTPDCDNPDPAVSAVSAVQCAPRCVSCVLSHLSCVLCGVCRLLCGVCGVCCLSSVACALCLVCCLICPVCSVVWAVYAVSSVLCAVSSVLCALWCASCALCLVCYLIYPVCSVVCVVCIVMCVLCAVSLSGPCPSPLTPLHMGCSCLYPCMCPILVCTIFLHVHFPACALFWHVPYPCAYPVPLCTPSLCVSCPLLRMLQITCAWSICAEACSGRLQVFANGSLSAEGAPGRVAGETVSAPCCAPVRLPFIFSNPPRATCSGGAA